MQKQQYNQCKQGICFLKNKFLNIFSEYPWKTLPSVDEIAIVVHEKPCKAIWKTINNISLTVTMLAELY